MSTAFTSIKKELLTYFLEKGDLSDTVRDDGRKAAQTLIGQNVYAGRRPRRGGNFAITLERAGGEPVYALLGEVAVTRTVIDVVLWAKEVDGVAAGQIDFLFSWINATITGIPGDLGPVTVKAVTREVDPFERPIPPQDASDGWTIRYVCPYRIVHSVVVPALD